MTHRIAAVAWGALAACSFQGPAADSAGPGPDGGGDGEPDAAEVGSDAAEPACAPLPSGAVAWWDGEVLGVDRLENFPMSDTFMDPSVEPGFVGSAMTLEDDEDIIIDPAPDAAAFTIEGWIRRAVDDPDDYMTIYANGDDAGLFLFDHKLTYYDSDTNNNGHVAVGATTIGLDVYTHVAAVYNGPVVTLYVNGVLDGTGDGNGAAINLPDPGRIGGVLFGVGDGDGNDFIGQIDEFTVYNRPLEAAEIEAIAAAGELGKCKE